MNTACFQLSTCASLAFFFLFIHSLIYCLADIHTADSLSLSSQRDDHRVRVVVCVADLRVFKDVCFRKFAFSKSFLSS